MTTEPYGVNSMEPYGINSMEYRKKFYTAIVNDCILTDDDASNRKKIRTIIGILKQKYILNPEEYFMFLRTYKPQKNGMFIIADSISSLPKNSTSRGSTFLVLRTYICEMVYNAIRSFPDVSEYTIIFNNTNLSKCYIVFGYFENELDENNEPGLCKIITDYSSFMLSKEDIYSLYVSNKVVEPDYDIINSLMISLFVGGLNESTSLSVSYVTNKKMKGNSKKYAKLPPL